MMKREIIPAILTDNADEALRRIRFVEDVAAWIQIDVLDRTLVPAESWHDSIVFNTWEVKPNVELHLMVNDPEKYIQEWKFVKNFKRAIWQIEAPIDHAKLIDVCRALGIEAGLGLAPETPVKNVIPFLKTIDAVLILGVHPGKSGQKFMRSSLKKITELRRLAPNLPISWDGGLTRKNSNAVTDLGVQRLVMGSALFS